VAKVPIKVNPKDKENQEQFLDVLNQTVAAIYIHSTQATMKLDRKRDLFLVSLTMTSSQLRRLEQ
jgi:hypothetical protein